MNPLDQAARYAAKRLDTPDFLHWLLPGMFPAWRWLDWLDTRTLPFPGEPDRICDTVAAFGRVVGDGPPLAFVVEFLARPSGEVLERLAEYMLRLRRETPAQEGPRVPYQVAGVVVNLTGPGQAGVWTMRPPDLGGLGWEMVAKQVSMREVSAAEMLAGVARGEVSRALLAWVPLMRGPMKSIS